MASDSYGGYFQVLTGGIAVGVNGRGHFTMSIYHQVGVGPASVAAVNWDSDSGFSYSAGAGIGSITGMPGPTAIAWYDMHQHSANVAFGGGVTDLLEIGYWESWPMDWPNFRSFFIDPLVLDLNGDGVKLVGVSDSTAYFDFDGDGFREKTGWFSPQDGLLVRDLNGNGRIESLLEMIGTANQDAYAVLRGFDQNGDLEITASDQVWASLLIWQDSNSNGITDAGELKTLSSLGITSIGLSNLNLDINRTGNYVHSQSEFNANGRGGVTEAVYFETAKNIGIFVPPVDFEPDQQVITLPALSGGGGMPSLSYSMTKDPSLRAAVKKLVLDSPELSASDFRAAVGEILVKWAGAEGVSPDSNGPYIDARNVKVVEKVGGTELAFSTVDAHWSGWIKGMYDHILDQYTDLFMIESFSSYFSQSEATTDQIARHQYRYLATMLVKPDDNTVWVNKGLFIDYAMLDLHLQGLDPVASLRSSSGNIALMNGLKVLNDLTGSGLSGPGMFLGQQPGLLWSGDNREAVSRTLLACMMSGTQLQNIEFGSGQAETIKLDYSSVVGFGDLGDDVILGSGADDVILGGGGNDLLAGGAGNDSYIWFHGDGNDVIDERVYGDGDKLILSGVKSGDISFLRADGDITLVVSASTPGGTDGGSVKLLNIDPQWNESVDTIVLADATWSLADLRAKFLLAAATTGNDYITGFKGNDLMIGGAGDDTLTGGAGADTLSGGAGNDMLIGGDGPDTFIWNRGDGQDEILGGGYFDSDTLVLKGVTEQQVILRLVNDALTIVIQPSSATSTDGGSVSIGSNATVVFDNATWTGDQLSARFYALQASPGADLITGTSGNDSILGGGGTPSLSRACSALLEASAGHRLAA